MKLPEGIKLTQKDVHIVVDLGRRTAKCFVPGEAKPRWTIEARGEGSDGPGYHPNVWGGDTPEGSWWIYAFELVPFSDPQAASFGSKFFFMRAINIAVRGNVGIGWHGGRGDLPKALAWAKRQGWLVTHGCLRSQNEDIDDKLYPTVNYTLKNGGRVLLTTVATPGAGG